MNMRYDGKVGAIACFQKECQSGSETEHSCFGSGIGEANGQLKSTHDNTEERKKKFLRPYGPCVLVQHVCNESTSRTENNVEKTEHCCPAAGLGLAHVREVLGIEFAQNGVYSKLRSKGTGIWDGNGGCGQTEKDVHDFLAARGHHSVCSENVNLSNSLSFRIDHLRCLYALLLRLRSG
jgi:hypothetical protein